MLTKELFTKEVTCLEEYNIASRNNLAYKFIKNQHLVHYKDDIISLKDDTFSVDGDDIILPEPSDLSSFTIDNILFNRNSSREFTQKKLTKQNLSDILYYSLGCKTPINYKKFVPQSGGLNSVEAFVFVLFSEDLPLGLYHYNSQKNSLTNIKIGNFSVWLNEHVFYQEEYSNATFVIVLTSNIGKLQKKYGLRSYRLGLLDVGHVSQNIYLISTAFR
jgi:SagB-type dehydrogenase family enzyme